LNLKNKDPPAVRVTEIHGDSFFLKIDFPHHFSHFKIELKTRSDNFFTTKQKTENKFFFFDRLKPDTIHVIRVMAVYDGNKTKTAWSKHAEVKTLREPSFLST
jgi:hypothetical protein